MYCKQCWLERDYLKQILCILWDKQALRALHKYYEYLKPGETVNVECYTPSKSFSRKKIRKESLYCT